MRKLEKYTGSKTYMFPSGDIATPDIVAQHYPASSVFAHVVETDMNGEVMYAIQNLSSMRTLYDIDGGLDENAAIAEIQRKMNEPSPVSKERPADIRQAEALETIARGVSSEDKAAVDALLGQEVKA